MPERLVNATLPPVSTGQLNSGQRRVSLPMRTMIEPDGSSREPLPGYRAEAPTDSVHSISDAKRLLELSQDMSLTVDMIANLPIMGSPADLTAQKVDLIEIKYQDDFVYSSAHPDHNSPIPQDIVDAMQAEGIESARLWKHRGDVKRVRFLNEPTTTKGTGIRVTVMRYEDAEEERSKRRLSKYALLPSGYNSFPVEALLLATIEQHPDDAEKRIVRVPLLGETNNLDSAMELILTNVQVTILQQFAQEAQSNN